MTNTKVRVMRKHLIALCALCASGLSSAEVITYLDVNGAPWMYSTRVGNQVVIMDKFARPTAFVPMPIGGSLPTTTVEIAPMILEKPMIKSDKSLPSLPSLPTINHGLFD